MKCDSNCKALQVIQEYIQSKDLLRKSEKIDKAFFAECIRQIDNGFRLIRKETITGQACASLIYSLEFSLQMALVYVQTMEYEPEFEQKFKRQIQELKEL